MTDDANDVTTGGCLCGALRYEARGEPRYAGYCYCNDCRKASGSGFIGFMGYGGDQITVTGETRHHYSPAASGNMAIRHFCATCNSLVYGGDQKGMHIYAGSLDQPAAFKPTVAVFTRDRPDWAPIPPGLRVFEEMPPPRRQSGSE